ncbi:MAG: hypothetical protein H8Z69_00380 [Nanohaloarchaea archaeon]|nr:hypothetical protein [Candidatus Nanohaloarchaea archaeon]
MKGQINIEFLASALLYLIAVGVLITSASTLLPSYSDQADKSGLNLEAKSVMDVILSAPGSHSFGSGGSDWEKNPSTLRNIESFGLANSFLQLEREKIRRLASVNFTDKRLNYSTFRDLMGIKNQFRFRFTWRPTIDTNRSFTRGDPPSNPDIDEPNDPVYTSADNKVRYGIADLEGVDYHFLVTAHDGVYDAIYASIDDWDFDTAARFERGQEIYKTGYTIESFQNRADNQGSLLLLEDHLKTFGARIDTSSSVVKFQRFASLEEEPIRIEVWTW